MLCQWHSDAARSRVITSHADTDAPARYKEQKVFYKRLVKNSAER